MTLPCSLTQLPPTQTRWPEFFLKDKSELSLLLTHSHWYFQTLRANFMQAGNTLQERASFSIFNLVSFCFLECEPHSRHTDLPLPARRQAVPSTSCYQQHCLWSHQAWVWVLAPPSGNSSYISDTKFPHGQNEDNDMNLMGLNQLTGSAQHPIL